MVLSGMKSIVVHGRNLESQVINLHFIGKKHSSQAIGLSCEVTSSFSLKKPLIFVWLCRGCLDEWAMVYKLDQVERAL
jgi:hypothetical protein